MAKFEVKIVRIDNVERHPDADRLDIVSIGGYRCISNRTDDGNSRYQAGDAVVYIPEQAVLPEWLLKVLGFWNEEKGMGGLAGSKGDRVKGMKLRGVLSQGVLLPTTPYAGDQVTIISESNNDLFSRHHSVGDDVAEYLGIIKYEPPIPASMSGRVWNASGMTINFDIENIQKYPDVFVDGEEIVATEKLHGTWNLVGYYPKDDGTGLKIVTSKGLSGKGLAFELDEENKLSNLYLQVLERSRDNDGFDMLERLINFERKNNQHRPIYLLGEIFGRGVQDLAYGEMTPTFRLFDVYVGEPGQGYYMNVDDKNQLAKEIDVEMVPELYRGPFSMQKMEELRDGMDFSGSNIREGVVILPVEEREHQTLGRVQLKFVSPAYILRKGGTELQ